MVEVQVPLPADFNYQITLQSHGWLQLAPFDYDSDHQILNRIQLLADGSVVRMVFHPPAGDMLPVAVESDGEVDAAEISTITRRIFNLDLVLDEFYDLLRGREEYAWVEQQGAGRLLCCPTVWEELVKTLMTTNTTWGATRNMVRRIVALGPAGGVGNAFPTPEQLADLDLNTLSEHIRAGYRAAYLSELAQRVASGEVDVESWRDNSLSSADLYEQITGLKGFGPYAAAIIMKLLGHFDRVAVDTSARNAFARLYDHDRPPADKEIRAYYQPYGRWQGLVMWMDLIRYYSDS